MENSQEKEQVTPTETITPPNHKSMEKKIPTIEKKPYIPKRVKDLDYVPYRCNIVAFRKLWEEVKEDLKDKPTMLEALKKELEKTPFWKIIRIYDNGLLNHMENDDDDDNDAKKRRNMKSDKVLSRVLNCYKPQEKKFKFGNTKAQVYDEDVRVIFGMPNEGASLPLPSSGKKKSEMTKTCLWPYFAGASLIRKTKIQEAIKAAIGKGEGSIQDLAKLVILHLLCTLLFPNSGCTLAWSWLKTIETVEEINKYNWTQGLLRYLEIGMKALAEKDPTKKRPAVSGCVILIEYWICERANIIEAMEGRKDLEPAFAKWDISALSKKLKNKDMAIIKMNNAEGVEEESEQEDSDDDFQKPTKRQAHTKGSKRKEREEEEEEEEEKSRKKEVVQKRKKKEEENKRDKKKKYVGDNGKKEQEGSKRKKQKVAHKREKENKTNSQLPLQNHKTLVPLFEDRMQDEEEEKNVGQEGNDIPETEEENNVGQEGNDLPDSEEEDSVVEVGDNVTGVENAIPDEDGNNEEEYERLRNDINHLLLGHLNIDDEQWDQVKCSYEISQEEGGRALKNLRESYCKKRNVVSSKVDAYLKNICEQNAKLKKQKKRLCMLYRKQHKRTSKVHAITTTIPLSATDGAVDTTVEEPDNMEKHISASTTVSSTKAAASTEKKLTSASTTDGAVDTKAKEPDNMEKKHISESTAVASTTVSSTKAAATSEMKQASASTTDGAVDTTVKEPDNMEKKHISASTTVNSTTISSAKAATSTEKKQISASTTVSSATAYAQLASITVQSASPAALLDTTTVPSTHNSREDRLEVKKMIVHAVCNSVKEICGGTTVPDDGKKDRKKTEEKVVLPERPKRGRKPKQQQRKKTKENVVLQERPKRGRKPKQQEMVEDKTTMKWQDYEMIKYMDEGQVKKLKEYWQKNDTETLFLMFTSREVIEALIKGETLEAVMIDDYRVLIEENVPDKKKSIQVLSTTYATFANSDLEEKDNFLHTVMAGWKNMMDAPYVFIPMLEHEHFTLLVFNVSKKEWTHYNPRRPKPEEDRVCSHFERAKEIKEKIEAWMNKNKDIFRSWNYGKANFNFLITSDQKCAQQKDQVSCGVLLLYYVEQLIHNKPIAENWEMIDVYKYRAKIMQDYMAHGKSYISLNK